MAFKDKKKERKYVRKWAQENKEHLKDYRSIPENRYKKNKSNKKYYSTLKGRFSDYKHQAKTRGFIFDLTFDEFLKIVNSSCYYCGGEAAKSIAPCRMHL